MDRTKNNSLLLCFPGCANVSCSDVCVLAGGLVFPVQFHAIHHTAAVFSKVTLCLDSSHYHRLLTLYQPDCLHQLRLVLGVFLFLVSDSFFISFYYPQKFLALVMQQMRKCLKMSTNKCFILWIEVCILHYFSHIRISLKTHALSDRAKEKRRTSVRTMAG